MTANYAELKSADQTDAEYQRSMLSGLDSLYSSGFRTFRSRAYEINNDCLPSFIRYIGKCQFAG